MKTLLSSKLRFEQMKGVGTMELDFLPDQRVYTLIGENGVGKTKFLESWFLILLLMNKHIKQLDNWFNGKFIPFKWFGCRVGEFEPSNSFSPIRNDVFPKYHFSYPVIYLSAQNRGNLENAGSDIRKLGSLQERQKEYFHKITGVYCQEYRSKQLKSLNMDTNIEEWIIQRAQSSNPYQAKEDNREVEIKTLLTLLNKIDERIDSQFLEISGDYRVFIKVENQKRELSELSSGFSSILKILQSIIAGYSYFTNETQIANVRGVVLIDEIESHLHNQWQVKIIPLLKKLFPNTIFFITTHSSLVISQLEHGEAYRLERNKNDGVVYGKLIDYPSNVSFIDLLHDAFDVNLNELKRSRLNEETQEEAKKALLKLVQQELANMGDK